MKATCTNTPTTGDLFDFQQVELSTDQKEQEDRLANTGSDLAQAKKPPKKPNNRTSSPAADERYLSDKAVAERFGVSRPTVWRWTKSKVDFPSPLKISDGVSRWRLSDLISFEANLANGGSR